MDTHICCMSLIFCRKKNCKVVYPHLAAYEHPKRTLPQIREYNEVKLMAFSKSEKQVSALYTYLAREDSKQNEKHNAIALRGSCYYCMKTCTTSFESPTMKARRSPLWTEASLQPVKKHQAYISETGSLLN